MPGVFYAGKVGYVFIDGTVGWAFDNWEWKPRTKILPRNTFIANGQDVNIAGFTGADLVISGPHDADKPIVLATGTVYTFTLGITPDLPLEFTVNARIADASIKNDAEDGPMLVINASSTGFLAPIV